MSIANAIAANDVNVDRSPTYYLTRTSHTCRMNIMDDSDPIEYGGNFKKLRHQKQFYEVEVSFISETPKLLKQKGSKDKKSIIEVTDQVIAITVYDTKYYSEILSIIPEKLYELCGEGTIFKKIIATLRIMNLADTVPASAA